MLSKVLGEVKSLGRLVWVPRRRDPAMGAAGLGAPGETPRVPPQPPRMQSPPGFPAPEEPIWGFLTGIPVFNWLAQNPSVSLQFPISVGITGKRRTRGTGGTWAQARDRDALSR